MTSEEHQREAERLLKAQKKPPAEASMAVIARAQVHATLALAAAVRESHE